MSDHALEITIRGSTLMAVPAVHFRIPPAEKVYRLCHQSDRPPQAIAVELTTESLAALVAWLRDLGVGRGTRRRLPCMLGLARRREAAAAPEPGDVCSESVLQELLCLSPTDSIIEAVRCALECGIPVYGVDLESGPEMHPPVMIQDTTHALGGRLASYVEMNATIAARSRDVSTAERREQEMAGRLLTLLREYPRVLFTGGMAHWNAIRALLARSDFAARPLPESCGEDYTRVLVHPLLALRYLDSFPRQVTLYEKSREDGFSVTEGETARQYFQCFHSLMQQVYESYFHEEEPLDSIDSKQADLQKAAAVQQILLNLCALGLKLLPDLATVVRAARHNLSDRFCKTLADVFMEFDWASPLDYPDLPLVTPAKNRKPGEEAGLPWVWQPQPVAPFTRSFGQAITWPSGDFLLSALAFRAQQLAEGTRRVETPEPFSGRMYDGIDLRATARARLRGERTVYVRRSMPQRCIQRVDLGAYEPTVYLFRPESAPPSAHWFVYQGSLPRYFRHFVRDQNRLEAVVFRKGDYSVTAVSYFNYGNPPASHRHVGISLLMLHGITIFRPAHLSLDEEARWVEEQDYSSNPIYHGGDFAELKQLYQSEYGIQLGESHWWADLVCLAIPYARRNVSVIIPDGFMLPRTVFDTARRHRVTLALTRHSSFPQEVLREASIQYQVPLCDDAGISFPDEITARLGRPDRYGGLVPKAMGDC